MRARNPIAIAMLLALATSACSKLTFIRQDAGRKDYRQVAPEYEFRKDPKRNGQLLAADRVAIAGRSLEAGDFAEAESQAKAALKSDPRIADAHTVLAVVASRRGQSVEAGQHYGKAVSLAPDRGDVLNNYGVWLCGNGRGQEALPLFERALVAPDYQNKRSIAWANGGSCALRLGQTSRAERDLRAALQFDPGNPTALSGMAQVEFEKERYLQARAFCERRLAAAAPDADILALAAKIEHKLGDAAAAARYSQQLAAFREGTAAQSGTVDNK